MPCNLDERSRRWGCFLKAVAWFFGWHVRDGGGIQFSFGSGAEGRKAYGRVLRMYVDRGF